MIFSRALHRRYRRRSKGFIPGSGHEQADQEKKKEYASEQDHGVNSHHGTRPSLIRINPRTFITLRRSALPTTLTELSAMAAAMTGGSVEAATGVLAGVAKRYIYRETSRFNQFVTPII